MDSKVKLNRRILISFENELSKNAGYITAAAKAAKEPVLKRLGAASKGLIGSAAAIGIGSAALLGYGAIKNRPLS
jgi:hypothetical protein